MCLELGLSTLTTGYRKGLFWAACLLVLAAAGPAGAQVGAGPEAVGAGEVYQRDGASGLALGGFDPVSFYLPEGPQPGRAEFEVIWGGVAWRFASEANRVAFAADPAAYAPRIGGYDALAAGLGRVVDASPAIYAVVRDRLYLFRNGSSRAQFLADPASAQRSEDRWVALKAGLVRP